MISWIESTTDYTFYIFLCSSKWKQQYFMICILEEFMFYLPALLYL